jgi:site-specific recombinase XerD
VQDVGGLVPTHLHHLRQHRNLRPTTVDQRRRTLRRLQHHLGATPLLEATTDDILSCLDDRDLKPESRATEISHLAGFYRWALLEKLIIEDPTIRVARPELPRRRPRPMPDVDVARALAGAPERVRPWLYLAAYAGLRACEVSGLKAEDLHWDVDPPIVLVDQQKGGDQGSVPMAGVLIDVLRNADLPVTGWLFPRRDDLEGPTPPHLVSRYANEYLHSLGISHTLHTLRHWFGSNAYLANNRDLRQTQELMRHRTPVSTAIYTFVDPGESAATVNKLPLFPV